MFLKRELVFPLFNHIFQFIMAQFDYSAEAELFFVGRKGSRRQPPGYKRFAQAALAVRFAVEETGSKQPKRRVTCSACLPQRRPRRIPVGRN
jgi:hypothetical protein